MTEKEQELQKELDSYRSIGTPEEITTLLDRVKKFIPKKLTPLEQCLANLEQRIKSWGFTHVKLLKKGEVGIVDGILTDECAYSQPFYNATVAKKFHFTLKDARRSIRRASRTLDYLGCHTWREDKTTRYTMIGAYKKWATYWKSRGKKVIATVRPIYDHYTEEDEKEILEKDMNWDMLIANRFIIGIGLGN